MYELAVLRSFGVNNTFTRSDVSDGMYFVYFPRKAVGTRIRGLDVLSFPPRQVGVSEDDHRS